MWGKTRTGNLSPHKAPASSCADNLQERLPISRWQLRKAWQRGHCVLPASEASVQRPAPHDAWALRPPETREVQGSSEPTCAAGVAGQPRPQHQPGRRSTQRTQSTLSCFFLYLPGLGTKTLSAKET